MDRVKIVQDEHERGSAPGDLVDDDVQQRVEWRRLRFLEHAQQVQPNSGHNSVEGGDEVLQEADGIIVAVVERKPASGDIAVAQPAADQRGFAVAGRSRDECQAACEGFRQGDR